MLDESKMNISMTGEEYIKYLNRKRRVKVISARKRNRWIKKNKSFLIGMASAVGVSLTILLIVSIVTYTPPVQTISIFERWASISWSALLKIGFCIVLISWLLHGVKVRLLA